MLAVDALIALLYAKFLRHINILKAEYNNRTIHNDINRTLDHGLLELTKNRLSIFFQSGLHSLISGSVHGGSPLF